MKMDQKTIDAIKKSLSFLKSRYDKFDEAGNRVAAGMDSQLYGLKDDGTNEGDIGFTSHPGLVDSFLGLGNFIKPVFHAGANQWRKAGNISHADTVDSVGDWIDQHLPDIVKNAPDRASKINQLVHQKAGLKDPEGFTQNAEEALGQMLTQIPLGGPKGGASSSAIKKALGAIPEYLGPTIRPSVGNYASGAVAGGALSQIPEWMNSLSELGSKYDADTPSIMDGMPMADGGQVDPLSTPFDSGDLNPIMMESNTPTRSTIQNPGNAILQADPTSAGGQHDTEWWNTYGTRPEYDFGLSKQLPKATISGYHNNTTNPAGGNNSGASTPVSLADLISTYKTGKGLYDKFTDKGKNQDGMDQNAIDSIIATEGAGALANTTPALAGTVEIGEIGDAAAGAGLGAAADGIDEAALNSIIATDGANAAGDAAAAGSAEGSTAGSTTGTGLGAIGGGILGVLAAINTAYGDKIYGSHSIGGGSPIESLRQKVLPIPDSPQSMLTADNIGRGYGNDASQGSGQWFTLDANGKPTWMGQQGTSDLSSYLSDFGRVADYINKNQLAPNDQGIYSYQGTREVSPLSQINHLGGEQSQYNISFNPKTGLISYDPIKTGDKFHDIGVKPIQRGVEDLYKQYGGSTPLLQWILDAYGVSKNQYGQESGATGGYLKNGELQSGYADGGKVKNLMKFLETISVNPHSTTGSKAHMLGDPIEDIKYGSYEAAQQGKLTPEQHASFTDLMNKYINGSPDVSDEAMANSLLDLHSSLFGGSAPLANHTPNNLLIPKPHLDPNIPVNPYGLNKTR